MWVYLYMHVSMYILLAGYLAFFFIYSYIYEKAKMQLMTLLTKQRINDNSSLSIHLSITSFTPPSLRIEARASPLKSSLSGHQTGFIPLVMGKSLKV